MPINIRQLPLARRLALMQPQSVDPQEIDWTNPTAQGLTACYIPTDCDGFVQGTGVSAGSVLPIMRDLAGNLDASPLNAGVIGRNVIVPGQLGVEAQDNALGAVTRGWGGTAPTILRPANTASLFVRSRVLTAGSGLANNPEIFSCVNNITNASPFTSYGLQRNSANKVQLAYNVAGTFATLASISTLTTGVIYNIGGVLWTNGVAGNSQIYLNGLLDVTGTPTSGSISYGAAAAMIMLGKFAATTGICGMAISVAYAWNRVVTADEMRWLNADPYMLIRSRARRRFIPSLGVTNLAGPQITMIS